MLKKPNFSIFGLRKNVATFNGNFKKPSASGEFPGCVLNDKMNFKDHIKKPSNKFIKNSSVVVKLKNFVALKYYVDSSEHTSNPFFNMAHLLMVERHVNN